MELTPAQLDWYNQGITLLSALMNGRSVDRDSAERKVFDEWRHEGHIITNQEGT